MTFKSAEGEMRACMEVLASQTGDYMLRKLGFTSLAKKCRSSIDAGGLLDGGRACIEALKTIFPAHSELAQDIVMEWHYRHQY